MKFISFTSRQFMPASHENPLSPGVLKKILIEKSDLQVGRVQMINWAKLNVGNKFAQHYHEDMQEIFIIVNGEAEITVGIETTILRGGDTIIIDHHEVHQMKNIGSEIVEYLAIGITTEAGGKTVVVEE
jgi:mannose-6-phosphate isomerase-like protein (cupin superfamily)